MGFKKPKTIYVLKFEDDEDLEGCVIKVKAVSSGDVIKMARLAGNFEDKETKVDPEEIDALINMFVESLVEWNLEEEDGRPIPPTFDEVKELELVFFMRIIKSWVAALAGVSESLKKDLNSTKQFQEGNTAMEASLSSLMS